MIRLARCQHAAGQTTAPDETEAEDFDLAAPWGFVRPRHETDEDGNKISEWITSMGSLRKFFG